jgi:hypothetical protein
MKHTQVTDEGACSITEGQGVAPEEPLAQQKLSTGDMLQVKFKPGRIPRQLRPY